MLAHRCTIFLCIWDGKYIEDQHRNTNMNDKDHLVGQLTRGGGFLNEQKNGLF